MRVLIVGSCVSADAFGMVAHRHVLKGYVPRLSLAAAFSLGRPPAKIIEAVKRNLASASHRYWVLNDLEGRLRRILQTAAFDRVLLDCIDERFDLLRREACIITRSGEFVAAEADVGEFERIASGSDVHIELWKQGLAELVSIVGVPRIIVNRACYASATIDGEEIPGSDAERRNLMLRTMYDHIAASYGCRCIDYDERHLRGDPQHKWGLSPVHFGPQFYEHTVRELDRLEGLSAGELEGGAAE